MTDFVYFANDEGPADALVNHATPMEYEYLITKGTPPYFRIAQFVERTS